MHSDSTMNLHNKNSVKEVSYAWQQVMVLGLFRSTFKSVTIPGRSEVTSRSRSTLPKI